MRRVGGLVAFAIAMGYLESAVVVYLRKIYYPEGFGFPLVSLDATIALTEIWRELATIIMLVGIGWLAGRSRYEKFSYFLLSFAVWDIFYYVFLWVLLGWPPSFFTWDILFLIPVMWVGPVIAPLILSATMLSLAVILLKRRVSLTSQIIGTADWWLLISGSLVAIVSFTADYSLFMLEQGGWLSLFSMDSVSGAIRERYIPQEFPWWMFGLAEGMIVLGVGRVFYRNRTVKQ